MKYHLVPKDWGRVCQDLRKLDRLLRFRWNWVREYTQRNLSFGPFTIHQVCITGGLHEVQAARWTEDFLQDRVGAEATETGDPFTSLVTFNDRTDFRRVKRFIREARREAERRRHVVM